MNSLTPPPPGEVGGAGEPPDALEARAGDLRRRKINLRREQLRRELLRRDAGSDYLAYVQHTFPGFTPSWVYRLLADVLMDWMKGQIPRLIIQAPPRVGKTEMVIRKLVPWLFGAVNRNARVMAVSYSASVANDACREVQETMTSDAHAEVFPGTRLWTPGQKKKGGGATIARKKRTGNEFHLLDHDGRMVSRGIGGSVTGLGFTHGILDDYNRDWSTAHSPDQRRKVREWYNSVFRTRAAPNASILVMATRWHRDDLIGHLLDLDRKGTGEGWTVVTIPARVTEANLHDLHPDDPRAVGEYLCPERFSPAYWRHHERDVAVWSALFQQNPVPDGGVIISAAWFNEYDVDTLDVAAADAVILSIDANFKRSESATASNACIQAWARFGSLFCLLDEEAGVWSYVELEEAVVDMVRRWPECRGGGVLIEEAANGHALLSRLVGQVPAVIAVKAEISKIARAHSVAPLYKAGQVLYPSGEDRIRGRAASEWIGEHREEVSSFPSGRRKDRMDATSQALRYLAGDAISSFYLGRADLGADDVDPLNGYEDEEYPPCI